MSWDQILTGFIYLAVVLVLVAIGKWVYTALHRGFVLRTQLLEKDNLAMALTIAGYYLGLAIVLGGVVSGPGSGMLTENVIDVVIFGLVAIVLLNLSGWINDKIIFSGSTTRRKSFRTATLEWAPSKAAIMWLSV